MVFEKILGKLRLNRSEEVSEEEQFVEVGPLEEGENVSVRIENLKNVSDTERIQSMIREGNVVFLRIKELRQKDINELKRSVERLKKTTSAMNGDIVGVDEDFLIVTPHYAKVYRGKAA